LSGCNNTDAHSHTPTGSSRSRRARAERSRAPDELRRLLLVAAVIVCVTLVWTRVAERSQRALDFSQCRIGPRCVCVTRLSSPLASFPSSHSQFFPKCRENSTYDDNHRAAVALASKTPAKHDQYRVKRLRMQFSTRIIL